jgi:hypothetical protein
MKTKGLNTSTINPSNRKANKSVLRLDTVEEKCKFCEHYHGTHADWCHKNTHTVEEKITWFHKLQHKLGWFNGYCDSFYIGKKLYMSFVCNKCGMRTGIHCIDDLIDSYLPHPTGDILKEKK